MTTLLDQPALDTLGFDLGRSLGPGEVVWLEGELGAGKTTFVRALVRGLGALTAASSPSYALVHHYEGSRGPIYHVDCFRLRDPEEANDLDWETLRAGDALLIEWPERAGGWAPRPSRRVRLALADDPGLRRVELG
ncbi:MAG TPA: tRNA (adenosine(37)-N6)-threonylcarbamoyltransferase complex ATPase subunit type 1 TsaE [Gemmatimonadales bacterium]|jgi:tRNA threonylcarbamoyladenosine biosynthesis protein TsaE|nr:tRNA (adenosine(37)-N6)-threonylcarbamoyltransferase complex ATPase subunit type 1 TsaE [Gemmatimonadales bacterium]